MGDLRHRWDEIQTAFVDEPRQAVERADRLVAETITQLAESFATQRTNLEHQWDRGDEVSTEELRQLLRRYRSFFDRLLTVQPRGPGGGPRRPSVRPPTPPNLAKKRSRSPRLSRR